jgi:hypothetical protein
VILCGIAFVFFAAKFGMKMVKLLDEHPAKTAAEAVIATDSDLFKTSENPKAGEITLRKQSSGEPISTTYEDLVFGRTTVSDGPGNSAPLFRGDLTKVPAWVPRYPGVSGETSVVHLDLPDRTGILAATTTDTAEDVEKFFEAEASKLSLSNSLSTRTDFNGNKSIRLHYEGGKRELIVNTYNKSGSPVTVQTIYTEKK